MVSHLVYTILVIDGSLALTGSHYGKPNKTIHVGNVRCRGNEENLRQCSKITYSLEEGKQLRQDTDVAGVSCIPLHVQITTSSVAELNQRPSSAANSNMSGTSVVTLVLLCIVFIALIVSVR